MTNPDMYIVDFDSSSSMLRAVGLHLSEKELPDTGIAPPLPQMITDHINSLSREAREFLYTWGGWWEATPSRRLQQVDSDASAQWIINRYPQRSYPGIMLGSSNG